MKPGPGLLLWGAFGVTCALVLATVLALGVVDPRRLVPLLTTGGVIESLPAVLFLLAAILAILLSVAGRERRLLWLLYGLFCVFLAGEEAGWGNDAVLGWTAAGEPSSRSSDLHSALTRSLPSILSVSADRSVSSSTAVVAAGAVLAVATGFLVLAVVLGVLASSGHSSAPVVRRFAALGVTTQFIAVGLPLLSVGFVDVLEESFGHPVVPFTWPLEESFELFGSLALLFAVLAKVGLLRRPRRS